VGQTEVASCGMVLAGAAAARSRARKHWLSGCLGPIALLVAAQRVSTFLLPDLNATRARSNNELETRSARETRRTASALLLGLSSAALSPGMVKADIPQWEDFNIGSGSKIRPSDEEIAELQRDYEKTWKLALESPLPDISGRALAKLKEIKALLNEADVDGARAILASPDLITMGLRITPRPKNPVKGAWLDCSGNKKCKDLLEETRASLQELEEWTFENRITYFNSEDRKQVNMQSNGVDKALAKIKSTLGEPLALVEQSQTTLEALAKMKA